MLMERMVDYARTRLALPPPMYQLQPIRYVIDLDRAGRPLGIPIDTADPATPAARRGTMMLAPHVKRSQGIRPKLLADNGVYALGIPTTKHVEEGRLDRVRQQHAAFVELVEACASATREPSVSTVTTFLRSLEVATYTAPEGFDPGSTLTFRVDGVIPIELPSVQAFWAGIQGAGDESEETAAGEAMECIVCGLMRPAMQRHPIKIKGIPGGQTSGTDLISANEDAFESYGLENSLIAPTCHDCAEAYSNGLNALLKEDETSLRVAETVHIFWTAKPTAFSPKRSLSDPQPEEVRELIGAWRTGRSAALGIDPIAFHAVSLSASGSRVVVRSSIDTTIGEAKRRLGRWFDLQALVGMNGDDGVPLPLWRLANATVRDARKDPPAGRLVDGLIRVALGGASPPLEVLFASVRRCRAEQDVNRERAALIKLVLGGRSDLSGGHIVSQQLDLANDDPAYLCGRLLAVLDAIQRRALNNPNATIVDKFYGTASSAPASVFGTLLHGAQPHLAKMRKDPKTQGAQRALEGRLTDVMERLDRFPSTLTLPQQGLFALGFYHQRAEDRRAARERRAANEAAAGDAETAPAEM